MSWFVLIFAGMFEVLWAVGLKDFQLTRPLLCLGTLAAVCLSMGLLGVALKNIPLGTAYAVWTGIGTLGTFIAGVIWFGESLSLSRLVCAGLIFVGIVGFKLTSH